MLVLVLAVLAALLAATEAWLAKQFPVPVRTSERPLGSMTPMPPGSRTTTRR